MAQMHHPVSVVFWERLVARAVPAIPSFSQKELSDLLWALQVRANHVIIPHSIKCPLIN